MDFKLKLDEQLLDSQMRGINRLRDGIYELRDKTKIVYEDGVERDSDLLARVHTVEGAIIDLTNKGAYADKMFPKLEGDIQATAKRAEEIRARIEGDLVGVNKRHLDFEKATAVERAKTRANIKKNSTRLGEVAEALSDLSKKYDREEELELKTLDDIRKAIVGLDERILAIETKPGFFKKIGNFFSGLWGGLVKWWS